MKYKSIFIGNIAEMAKPLMKLMDSQKSEEELWEDHWLCDRFLFSDVDDRILITPVPIEKNFFADSCQLLNYKNTVNWWPKKVGESTSEAILEDKELLEKVVREIKLAGGQMKIAAYEATAEFMGLVKELRKMGLNFETPEMPKEENLWLINYFGSKAGFRQATANLGKDFPAMPQGGICTNKEEIIGWASYLLRNTAGFVIKANRGTAGAGLRIVKKEEVGERKPEDFVEKMIEGKRYWVEEIVVVEEYIPPDMSVCGGNPNIELMIPPEGGVKPLYPCGMRVTPEGNFRGVEFGKGAVQKEAEEILVKSGTLFGEYLQKMGYRGYFEIDFVPRSLRQIHPIEASTRRTGGTHAYELALRLLGKDFADHYYLTTSNLLDAPKFKGKDYLVLKSALSQVLYPIKGKKEGVVLTITNLLKKGQLGYAVVGESRERVGEIENQFLSLL